VPQGRKLGKNLKLLPQCKHAGDHSLRHGRESTSRLRDARRQDFDVLAIKQCTLGVKPSRCGLTINVCRASPGDRSGTTVRIDVRQQPDAVSLAVPMRSTRLSEIATRPATAMVAIASRIRL
jgi:hypothetical protein